MNKEYAIVRIYGIQRVTVIIVSRSQYNSDLEGIAEVLFESNSYKEVCDKFNQEYGKKKEKTMYAPSMTQDTTKYDVETKKSEYQCNLEWLRKLLINIQENNDITHMKQFVPSTIKWLTDKITLACAETNFYEKTKLQCNYDELNEKEKKVLKLINEITDRKI